MYLNVLLLYLKYNTHKSDFNEMIIVFYRGITTIFVLIRFLRELSHFSYINHSKAIFLHYI